MNNKRLEQLRLDQGLTKREAAKAFNVSESTYGKWELARRKPDSDTIIKIANYFQVTVDYLLGISDNPKPYENHHYYVEDGRTYIRKYSETDVQTRIYLVNDDGTQTLIEKEASDSKTPSEAAIEYFIAENGREPTIDELKSFLAVAKGLFSTLPDKSD